MAKTVKEWKAVGHYERLHNPEYDNKFSKPYTIVEVVERLVDVDEEIDGEIIKVTKVVKVDPRKEMAQYEAKTFKLSNIIAAGAVDTLKYGTVTGMLNDIDKTLDKITNISE